MGCVIGRPENDMVKPQATPEPLAPPAPLAAPEPLAPPAPKKPPMEVSHIDTVEAIIGYRFSDRKLVEEAMTHPSYYYPAETSTAYERLEFLGDAILNCTVTEYLFLTYPTLQPGPLTRLRASNVDKEKLVRTAVGCGLHKFLRHNAPQLDSQLKKFIEEMDQYPMHSNGLLDPPKAVSDCVESLLGAIYIDSNSNDTVWQIFKRLAEPFVSPETLGKHPVSELNEWCQKTRSTLKFVQNHWEEDLSVEVLVNGEVMGSATYGFKKDVCQNRAAKAALENLAKMKKTRHG